jgi:murein DD-endopeptidase MepM/ murein hydrolase activator NlpD
LLDFLLSSLINTSDPDVQVEIKTDFEEVQKESEGLLGLSFSLDSESKEKESNEHRLTSDNFISPTFGEISSRFGPRWGRMHKGLDIAAPLGTPVVASADGVIEIPPYDTNGYGNWIVVIHANGYETYYGHLSEILVKEGQRVKAGHTLGLVGSTGTGSSGPHLHHEIRLFGEAKNPENYYKVNY